MSEAGKEPTTTKGHAPKGSKAALEAAGWQFTRLPAIDHKGEGLPRRFGNRGTMAIAPAGSGIEPKQFDGAGRATAWAVEQSARLASNPPIGAVAGMGGLRFMLGLALASGEVCTGPDAVPARPDAELLSVCGDALMAKGQRNALLEERRRVWRSSPEQCVSEAMDRMQKAEFASLRAVEDALKILPALHASTREGLLQKARATLLVHSIGYFPASFRDELAKSVIADLIHLVPTLIDERGGLLPPVPDAGGECLT